MTVESGAPPFIREHFEIKDIVLEIYLCFRFCSLSVTAQNLIVKTRLEYKAI